MITVIRTAACLVILLSTCGCCTFQHCVAREDAWRVRLLHLEQKLAEFSKAVNAYNAEHPMESPFGEESFFRILGGLYPSGPNHDSIIDLQRRYTVRTRSIPGGNYAVVVCEKDGRKLLEDLSCLTTGVEVRLWDKPNREACGFTADTEPLCAPSHEATSAPK